MKDLKKMSLAALIDQLADQTRLLVKMMRERKTSTDYENCKARIKELTAEIEERKTKE